MITGKNSPYAEWYSPHQSREARKGFKNPHNPANQCRAVGSFSRLTADQMPDPEKRMWEASGFP